MSLLWRSLKIVAVALGVLLGLVAVAAASVYAYGEAESNRATPLSEPTGPYAVGRVSYHWTDRSREETFTEKKGDERELMVFVWYPAQKPAPSAKYAPYLPGKWGEERQEDYGVHRWPAALGVERGDEFPDEREVQTRLQAAVEVVLRDQIFERDVSG